MLFASCSKEEAGTKNPDLSANGTAYVSVSIEYPNGVGTRAEWNEEGAESGEVNVKNVYLVTFDENDNIVTRVANGNISSKFEAAEIGGAGTTTNTYPPVAVSPKTKQILVVTSPGPELKKVLEQPVGAISTFDELNQVITLAFNNQTQRPEELVGEVREMVNGKTKHDGNEAYQYFTMINSGWFANQWNDPARSTFDGANICLVPVKKVAIVGSDVVNGEYPTEEEAKAAASQEGTTVDIERLTAKLQVLKNDDAAAALTGAKLRWPDFATEGGYWTLDVLNSKFFPYAEKHNSTTAASPAGNFYKWAYYTVDPNYVNKDIVYPSGLKYNNLTATKLEPKVTWLGDNFDYCLENTMEAESQLYKLATRIVVRGYYWPAQTPETVGNMDATATAEGDWFRYAGVNYASLADLQDFFVSIRTTVETNIANSVTPDPANVAFLEACAHFVKQVKAQAEAMGVTLPTLGASLPIVDLEDLTQADLNMIVNGGELVKHSAGCIRWYQKGLNYWYYEIRHDSGKNGSMAQDKYGVVRNNWYYLTMTTVSGHGTPWYPSIVPDEERPDPNDPDKEYDPTDDKDPDPIPDPKDPKDPTPDPEDPIDPNTGFLEFNIRIAPWVYWTNPMPLS